MRLLTLFFILVGLPMSQFAWASDRWIDFYLKQPNEFVMQFMCEDIWHHRNFEGKMRDWKPKARFVQMKIYKSEGGKKTNAEIKIDPTYNKHEKTFWHEDVTGFYDFGGYVHEKGELFHYEMKAEEGIIHYHKLNPKMDLHVTWKAKCRRVGLIK